MKDDLDRVLEGLRRVETPLGLEGRVLRAMEASPKRGFAWVWVGAVAIVLAGVLIGTLGTDRHGKMVGFADNPPFHEAERMGHPVVVEKRWAVVANGKRRDSQRDRSSTSFLAKSARNSAQKDAGAEITVGEGGFPAPPAPLTEQERLLLKLAARATPRTMVVFDTRLREERAAAEKAAFEFFNPQPAVVTAEPEETDHAVQGKQ
jgi:hypothetical protein